MNQTPESNETAKSNDSRTRKNENAPTNENEAAIFDPARALRAMDGDVEILREIVREFLDVSVTDIQQLRDMVANSNAETAGQQAHKIKGAAANIGAEALRAVALEIETSAKANDLEKVNNLLDRIEQEFNTLKSTLNELDWENLGKGEDRW